MNNKKPKISFYKNKMGKRSFFLSYKKKEKKRRFSSSEIVSFFFKNFCTFLKLGQVILQEVH
ncbi:hypothetical protein J1609_09465, partial [Leuconostoc mesenteroides]|nr:hypothetical protein [Leuconostoc mesenteroides]